MQFWDPIGSCALTIHHHPHHWSLLYRRPWWTNHVNPEILSVLGGPILVSIVLIYLSNIFSSLCWPTPQTKFWIDIIYWYTTEVQAFDTLTVAYPNGEPPFFSGNHHSPLKSSNIFHGKLVAQSPLGFGRFHLGKMHRTPNGFTEFWGEKKGMFREKQQKGMFQFEEKWFVSRFRNVWRNLVTSVSKLTNITARKLHQTHGVTLCFWGFQNSSSFRIGKYIIPRLLRWPRIS